jgi:hypothetical protein
VVDGIAWPDLRLMMIDSEETSRNSHAIGRHGEVAAWTDLQYAASVYKFKADAAKAYLQNLIDTRGIDYVELNPHVDASGAFDDRVDVYGRYLGFVYGGGQCFNAAMLEAGHADVYHYKDGKYHVPEMELKDYFSYTGVNADSIETTTTVLVDLSVTAGLYEIIALLAYAAGGYVWSVAPGGAVSFRRPTRPDRVEFFDRLNHAATLESNARELANAILVKGNPLTSIVDHLFTNGDSIDEYGFRLAVLELFSLSNADDAAAIVAGLLKDVAYPARGGQMVYLNGVPRLRVGEILELRGGDLRRLNRVVSGEWDDRFTGRTVGRVASITHEFRGRATMTTAQLTSPLRSVNAPLSFLVRSQPPASTLYEFRLDETGVGLDMGYHLD